MKDYAYIHRLFEDTLRTLWDQDYRAIVLALQAAVSVRIGSHTATVTGISTPEENDNDN